MSSHATVQATALQRKRRQEAEAARRQLLQAMVQDTIDRAAQLEVGESAGLPLFLQSSTAIQTASPSIVEIDSEIDSEILDSEILDSSSDSDINSSSEISSDSEVEPIDQTNTTESQSLESEPESLSAIKAEIEIDPEGIDAESEIISSQQSMGQEDPTVLPSAETEVKTEVQTEIETTEQTELAADNEASIERQDEELTIADTDEITGLNNAEVSIPEESAISVDEATITPVDSGTDSNTEDNSAAIVQAWQTGVQRSAQAIPVPTPGAAATGHTQIQAAGQQATAAQRQQQQTLPTEAAGNVPPTPEVERPPAPPAGNPIPAQTQAVEAASDQRLPAQTLPALVASRPLGTQPRLGMRPVSAQMFQLIMTPGAIALAQISTEANNPERQEFEKALRDLRDPLTPALLQGTGQPVPLVDQGPQPIRPLPQGQQTPLGNVIARLLAQPEVASRDVLMRLRQIAYPNGVLKQEYPDIGAQLQSQLQPELDRELREIAAAAGVSATQLDTMVQTRHQELAAQAQQAQSRIQETGEAVCRDVSQSGQQTLNTIAGVRQSTDETIVQRQEATSGGNDPQVINARRDLVMRWVQERVTTQITNYQNAGDRRNTELTQGQRQQEDAYNATAQRDEYQILHGETPPIPSHEHPASEDDRQRLLQRLRQDRAAEGRAWARDEITRVQGDVRRLQRTASDTTRTHRTTIETAGTAALTSARQWAEDRILEGRSWWERMVARLTGWLSDAQAANARWEVARTQQTRDGIVQDLDYVTRLQTEIQNGATQQELLQREGLSQEQRAIIEAYFQQGGSRHPLDLAAVGLRQRLASNHRTQAIATFEQELLATPIDNREKLDKLNQVGRAMRPGFDAAQIAQDAHAAMDQWGTDEAAIYRSLQGLNAIQAAAVRKFYRYRYDGDLDDDLADELSEEELDRAQLLMSGRQSTADAVALHDAVAGLGTDEAAIMDLLRSKSPEEVEAIRSEYQARYGESLDTALQGDLGEGNEQDQANALLRGDTATADAIALDEAMRGGIVSWGTNEEEIQRTYQRTRDDVLAMAQREGWNAEQMEAEVRRRNQVIEQRFNTRYANVEEYQVPGMAGQSVLRQAIASEMDPGPERDLTNALADNDMLRADAARIEIERQGIYASDEAINGVLRGQYERSLQATRLDQGPARRMTIDREMRELLQQNPHMTEEDVSRQRFQLEHQMERTVENEAQERSRISMDALQNAYNHQYGRPLSYVLEVNMSGNDLARARDMLRQGGRLTAFQEVVYATRGEGTDEDALRRTFSGMTRSEIAEVRKQWHHHHPSEDFDAMIRGELSGRDQFDIMDMVEHGAPESASERIAQQRRHAQQELNSTGFFGGVAAGREATWLNRQMADLDRMETQLRRTDLSPEERLRFRDELDMRVERVEGAIEDHRRAIDSVTDTATQIVGIVVGIAVTTLTAGALGPVMVAVLAAAASTLATMATKRLIQGEAYGVEDMGVDLAVGVVDAITSAATAGLGGRLLRGASEGGEAVARAASPSRLTLFRDAIAQRVARSPGLSRLNQMESGFLTRGITGQNPLARMAARNNRAMQIFAELLAEGIENTTSAVPSTLASTLLSDQTWHGNVALNILEGTAMGVGTSIAMGGGMQVGTHVGGHLSQSVMRGAGHLYHGVQSHIRNATPAGRIREANHILGDAFQGFLHEHPTASYSDFMAHPDGAKAMAEVQQRGLLPNLEPDVAPALHPAEIAAPHPDATAAPRSTTEPTAKPAIEAQAEALRNGLPAKMRETIPVEINPELPGRSVRAVPDIQGGRVVGVKIMAGPDARPIDILMHAPTIQGMQRYSGLLGRIRTLLERAESWFYLEKHVPVGSRAWEARLELQKLPAIIEERMRGLSRPDLDPIDRVKILAEVEHLSQQIDAHQRTIVARDISPGRGFVAADDQTPHERLSTLRAALDDHQSIASHAESVFQATPLKELRSRINQGEFGDAAELGKALQTERLRILGEVQETIKANLQARYPGATIEFKNLGTPGFGSDCDITVKVTGASVHENVAASVEAVRDAYHSLRQKGFDPDRALDANFYTELHESSLPVTPREAHQIQQNQSAVSLAEMRMNMSDSQWQTYRSEQLQSLGEGLPATGLQAHVESQARGHLEQQFREAEAIAARLKNLDRTQTDVLAERQQALLEALERKAPTPEIRQIMAEIKLLEPDAYGTRAAVEGVVDYQQAIARGSSETYIDHPRRLPKDGAGHLAVLGQEASASLGKMFGHTKSDGNSLSDVRSIAKYLGRVEHALMEAGLDNSSNLIALKNLLMAAKHSEMPDQATAQALRDWAQQTNRGHLSEPQLRDAWVTEAQRFAQGMVIGIRSAELTHPEFHPIDRDGGTSELTHPHPTTNPPTPEPSAPHIAESQITEPQIINRSSDTPAEQINRLTKQRHEAVSTVHNAEAKLRTASQSLDDAMTAKERDLAPLIRKQESLETSRSQRYYEWEALERHKEQLERQNAPAEEIAAVDRQIRRKTGIIESTEARIAQVQRQMNEVNADHADRLATAERNLTTVHQQLAAADQIHQQLAGELVEALTMRRDLVQTEIEAGNSQIKTLEREKNRQIAAIRAQEDRAIEDLMKRHPGLRRIIESHQTVSKRGYRRIDPSSLAAFPEANEIIRRARTQENTINNQHRQKQYKHQQKLSDLERQLGEHNRQIAEVSKDRQWLQQGFADLGNSNVVPCFPPDTLVKTPVGDRKIQDVVPGDLVYAYDMVSQQVRSSPVLHIWENWTEYLVQLELEGGEHLAATRSHPFWVGNQSKWINAEHLDPNTTLQNLNNQPVKITSVHLSAAVTATYNLEVDETHTYYVGQQGVLVHNSDLNGDVNPNSRFMKSNRQRTRIYQIMDTSDPKNPKVIYIGKTYQGSQGDMMKRFAQHLAEAGDNAAKARWQKLEREGKLKKTVIRAGEWTEFETAVWEQHYITLNGGPQTQDNPKRKTTTLENRRNEMTEETYRRYKDAALVDRTSQPFRHNPC
jgi:Pretoxin HINT domain/Annexin